MGKYMTQLKQQRKSLISRKVFKCAMSPIHALREALVRMNCTLNCICFYIFYFDVYLTMKTAIFASNFMGMLEYIVVLISGKFRIFKKEYIPVLVPLDQNNACVP